MSINTPTIAGLYAITDPTLLAEHELIEAVKNAILGGARIIQYRNKQASAVEQYQQAKALSLLCKEHQVCFIINDDPDLAQKVSADGVHIGQNDAKIKQARVKLGPAAIIGVSCYNQLSNAQTAVTQGADYVAFGRFFPSKTKPSAVQADLNLLEKASRQLNVPIVAIGGITRQNASQVINSGANAVAVINDLFQDVQSIYSTAKEFQALFIEQHQLIKQSHI